MTDLRSVRLFAGIRRDIGPCDHADHGRFEPAISIRGRSDQRLGHVEHGLAGWILVVDGLVVDEATVALVVDCSISCGQVDVRPERSNDWETLVVPVCVVQWELQRRPHQVTTVEGDEAVDIYLKNPNKFV